MFGGEQLRLYAIARHIVARARPLCRLLRAGRRDEDGEKRRNDERGPREETMCNHKLCPSKVDIEVFPRAPPIFIVLWFALKHPAAIHPTWGRRVFPALFRSRLDVAIPS